jgi:hypothetical protein
LDGGVLPDAGGGDGGVTRARLVRGRARGGRASRAGGRRRRRVSRARSVAAEGHFRFWYPFPVTREKRSASGMQSRRRFSRCQLTLREG